MTDRLCRHRILSEPNGFTPGTRATVSRCAQHSEPVVGGAVWVWSARALPTSPCLCGIADRFLVATEPASAWWRQSADVVLGTPQTTVHGALCVAERLAGLP